MPGQLHAPSTDHAGGPGVSRGWLGVWTLATLTVLLATVATGDTGWTGSPRGGTMEFRFSPMLGVLLVLLMLGWLAILVRALRSRGIEPALRPAAAPPEPATVLMSRRGRTVKLLAPDEIDWFQASGRYVTAHMGGKKHLLDDSLTALIERLPATEFVQVHRSAIVRVDRIASLTSLDGRDFQVALRCGDLVRMSRTYRGRLEEALGVKI